MIAEYPSLDHAKIIMNDLITNIRESATLDTDALDVVLLELELSMDDAYGFSFLFQTNFQFQRNVQS